MTQLMEPRSPGRSQARRRRALPRLRQDARAEAATRSPVPRWRRIVPALAISTMVMAYVYATVPFTFAGAVECHQHGLSGATVAPGTPAGTIIGDMDLRCAEAGSSRVAAAGTAATLAAVVGLAGAFAPTTAEAKARRGGGSGDGNRVPEGARPVPAGLSQTS